MNDWEKFSESDSDTWPDDGDIVLAYRPSVGRWLEAEFKNRDGKVWFSLDGYMIPANQVTDCMKPGSPDDQRDTVRVPRELSEEDEKGIRSTPLGGCYEEYEVQEMHEAFVEYFGRKSPETKEQE